MLGRLVASSARLTESPRLSNLGPAVDGPNMYAENTSMLLEA